MHVVSVVPDVSGLDRAFDYLVPTGLSDVVAVGDIVRVPLHGRNVRGWVVGTLDASTVDASRLKSLISRVGCGPSPEIVELARWAAGRWCGRWRSTLISASPPRVVQRLPEQRRQSAKFLNDAALAVFDTPRTQVLRRGPRWDLSKFIQRIASRGPALVVLPTVSRATMLQAELRRAGVSVATYPEEWAHGAGGVDVVVGARSAVFARIPNLASIVVVDEHEDALQESRNPTWHARDVSIERARRLHIPCFLLSPIPSVAALVASGGSADTVDDEPRQWPSIEVVDRTVDDQWSDSLVSSRLVELARDHDKRIVVVLNVKGRSRLLACGACRNLVSCERCAGSMSEVDEGLTCGRCGLERPAACLSCGSAALRNLRPGIKRLGEDLLKASGRDPNSLAVVDAGVEIDQRASLFVGTEAALHRVRRPDVVVFADIDQELFAPRYRSSEIVASLVVAAARSVGDGLVVVQTHSPKHSLIGALQSLRWDDHLASERRTREMLRLPPFSVLGSFGGSDGPAIAARLAEVGDLDSWSTGDETVVRFADSAQLAKLMAAEVATGNIDRRTVRVHVDPPRV